MVVGLVVVDVVGVGDCVETSKPEACQKLAGG
jgi:hypothetical protein